MDEESTQQLLRDEIAELRAALDARFHEIAVLTRMLEEANPRHDADRRRQVLDLAGADNLEALLDEGRKTPSSSRAQRALLKAQRALLKKSSLFDAAWYLARNIDVADAGMDPAEHYLKAGTFECRDPGPDFSTKVYYLANSDVAKSGWSALGHYLAFGRQERRSGGPTEPGSA